MTRTRRAGALAIVATLVLAGLTAAPAHAAGSRAVVIVDTGSGTYARVISFDGTISGYEALELAGAGPATYGFAGQGLAVCQLFGVGNAADDSCLGTGDDPRYWAYYRAPAGSGGWQYARGGAGATTVSDGDVEGWRFGTGGAPGFRSFCDVVGCAPPSEPEPIPGPGATVGGATADAAGGSDTAGTGGGGTGPAAEASGSPGAGPETDAAAGPVGADSTGPTVTGTDGAAARRGGGPSRTSGNQALGAAPVVADDGGAGSPTGVLVALALVALIGVVAVVLRRRGRSAD